MGGCQRIRKKKDNKSGFVKARAVPTHPRGTGTGDSWSRVGRMGARCPVQRQAKNSNVKCSLHPVARECKAPLFFY